MDNNDRQFQHVIKYASALCMALCGAFVGSIKQINPSTRFELDTVAVAAGVLSCAAVLVGWQFIFGKESSRDGQAMGRGKRFGAVAAFFLIATIAAFMYALKDLSHEKRNEVAIGALSGLAAIALIGTVVWRIICFLEADYERGIEDERNHDGGQ